MSDSAVGAERAPEMNGWQQDSNSRPLRQGHFDMRAIVRSLGVKRKPRTSETETVKSFRALAFIFGFTGVIGAANAAGPTDARQYRDAVVKITVKHGDLTIGWGAGFFIADDGRLATNFHVVRAPVKSAAFTAEFSLADGRVIRRWSIGGCGDERGLDLCVLKIPVRPRAWFSLASRAPKVGDAAYVIGHPRGEDFALARGLVSASRQSAGRSHELEFTAAISPGYSGGPIFDARGGLVGVATRYRKGSTNVNFGLAADEIEAYAARSTNFIYPDAYRKSAAADFPRRARALSRADFGPAFAALARGDNAAGARGFRSQRFDFGNAAIDAPVPLSFEACRREIGSEVFSCAMKNGSAILTVQRLTAERGESLLALRGTRMVPRKALPAAEAIAREGSWPALAVEAREEFYSRPSPADCRKLKSTSVPGAFFNEAPACRFGVANDADFGAYSYALWAQRDGYVYGFQIWMTEAGWADYFRHVVDLIAASSTRARKIAFLGPSN